MAHEVVGQLLLAMPTLQDQNFKDSAILLCHHDEEGSMGLIINRPQHISILDVFDELGLTMDDHCKNMIPDHQLSTYEGGPIDTFRGFVLHDGWHVYDSTMQVSEDIHLSTSHDILEDIARGTGPEHFMFVLGYAGWTAGQLERELLENSWIVSGVNQQILFQSPPEHRWALSARSIGVDKAHLSSQSGHA